MKLILVAAAALSAATAAATEFEKPVRLKAGDKHIRVEAPGYAAPAVCDIDQDGKLDLLVGQFRNGKIHVFKGKGDLKFAKSEWLQADGKPAEVPGVW